MMRFISNSSVDTSVLYLSHGITWGKHRYIRREGSPGNYRYIYPEDTSLVNSVRNSINSKNSEGATLFGDSRARQRYMIAKKADRSLKKISSKIEKDLGKQEQRISETSAKAMDTTKGNRYQKRQQKKLEKLQKAYSQSYKNLENVNKVIENGQAVLNAYKDAYNASRKIDDIPSAILEVFSAKKLDSAAIANPSGAINRMGKRSVANRREHTNAQKPSGHHRAENVVPGSVSILTKPLVSDGNRKRPRARAETVLPGSTSARVLKNGGVRGRTPLSYGQGWKARSK